MLAAGDPSRIWETLPELMHMAAGSYLGREAADEAFEAARAFLSERDGRSKGGMSA